MGKFINPLDTYTNSDYDRMHMINDKAFQRLWWLVFTLNLALAGAFTYAVIHFVRKYW